MYADPKRVRRRQTVYLDEYEMGMLDAIANYSGDSKSAIARQLLLLGIETAMGVEHTPGVQEFLERYKVGKTGSPKPELR